MNGDELIAKGDLSRGESAEPVRQTTAQLQARLTAASAKITLRGINIQVNAAQTHFQLSGIIKILVGAGLVSFADIEYATALAQVEEMELLAQATAGPQIIAASAAPPKN